ncbi:hypothetical protein HT031_004364 [Scenedesmus sp. PABB004]|nr:hypothetical protein HT031_004364 [Scenedesmus sp. PABB004]
MAHHHRGAGGGPDPYLVATTKLGHDWSANRAVPHVSGAWLEALLADERWPGVEPMLKLRLLLAGLVAAGQVSARAPGHAATSAVAAAELVEALGALQRSLAGDADEWLKVMSAAAGRCDGRLELEPAMEASPAMAETMAALRQAVGESANQALFPPLEDAFLRVNPPPPDPGAPHFALRAAPRVQPLTSSVSYATATPPPPTLASPRQPGEHHGATFLRPTPRANARGGLERAPSGLAAAAAAAAAGAGASAGTPVLARSKSGLAPKAQKIQLLGAEEQREMQDVLSKSLRAKGHGVAVSVRHEAVPGHELRPRGASESGAGRGGGGGGGERAGGAGDVVLRQLEQEGGVLQRAGSGSSDGGGGGEPGPSAAAAGAQSQRMKSWTRRARRRRRRRRARAGGARRAARALRHAVPGGAAPPADGAAAATAAAAAAELQDDGMELDAELQDASPDAGGGAPEDGDDAAAAAERAAALAAKRKRGRVIIDDDDDDDD